MDDNDLVAEAVELKLRLVGGFEWAGRLADAESLLEEARARSADVVLLDIDMPGRDPFEALEELASVRPQTRVIMLSGHVRSDLVDRAVEAGAWGYLSKSEGTESIVSAIDRVAHGEFAMGPDVAAEYGRA